MTMARTKQSARKSTARSTESSQSSMTLRSSTRSAKVTATMTTTSTTTTNLGRIQRNVRTVFKSTHKFDNCSECGRNLSEWGVGHNIGGGKCLECHHANDDVIEKEYQEQKAREQKAQDQKVSAATATMTTTMTTVVKVVPRCPDCGIDLRYRSEAEWVDGKRWHLHKLTYGLPEECQKRE